MWNIHLIFILFPLLSEIRHNKGSYSFAKNVSSPTEDKDRLHRPIGGFVLLSRIEILVVCFFHITNDTTNRERMKYGKSEGAAFVY